MLGWGEQTGCTPALIYELVRASGSLQDVVSQHQVLQRVSEGGITVKVFFFLDHRLLLVECVKQKFQCWHILLGDSNTHISEISYPTIFFSVAAPN